MVDALVRAWTLKVQEIVQGKRPQPLPSRMMLRSFCMPIWTTSTPAGKSKSSFTVTSIISGLRMRNRISSPSTSFRNRMKINQRGVYPNRSFSLPKASSQFECGIHWRDKDWIKANKYTFVWRNGSTERERPMKKIHVLLGQIDDVIN